MYNYGGTAGRVLAALDARNLGLKHKGAGKFRCEKGSPLRTGSDSNSFALTIEGNERGVFTDHVSGDKGSLYDLADALGVERTILAMDASTSKRAYSSLAHYAEAHGVPETVFRAAGWRTGMHWCGTHKRKRPALLFDTANGTRARFTDGEKPHYISPTGYTACWYGLKPAVNLACMNNQPLVICNGEASTVGAQHHGVAACAITGGEKQRIPDALFNELQAAYRGPVLLAFDCDDTGRKAAHGIGEQLRTASYDVRAIDLNGGTGFDLADFCKLHKDGSAHVLQQLPDLPDMTPYTAAHNSHNSHNSSAAAPEVWDAPIPLTSWDVPSFPTHALPKWLGTMVAAEAEATQTPADLAGMLALAVLATTCHGKIIMQVKPGYCEPVNVFTVTALPPGSRKSAVFKDMTAPIEDHEATELQRMAAEIAAAATEYQIMERRLETIKQAAAKATDADDRAQKQAEAQQLARELATMRVPPTPRWIADDVTPERLASLLYEQGGRMAVLSAEGDLFDLIAGRYTNGAANFGVLLKGHAGDPLRIDRGGRPAEFIEAPALTLGLTVQPDVIHGLARKPGFRGRGVLGRILYAMPRSRMGHRTVNAPPVPHATRATYAHNIQALLVLAEGTDEHGAPTAHVLRLDAAARAAWDHFSEWLEPQLADTGDLGYMTDWAGKLPGAVARIAALLHMAEHAVATPWQQTIAHATMNAAISIGRYLLAHAQAAYGVMGADDAVADATYLWRMIEDKGVATLTKRDAFEWTKGRFKKVATLEPALALLVEHGFIRQQAAPEQKRPGKHPSPRYDVNKRARSIPATPHDMRHTENMANIANIANVEHAQQPTPLDAVTTIKAVPDSREPGSALPLDAVALRTIAATLRTHGVGPARAALVAYGIYPGPALEAALTTVRAYAE